MISIREELQKGTLLFDGAMGTYFSSLPGRASFRCERANLDYPEEVAAIHASYMTAGCRAIKTNTFTLCSDLAEGEQVFDMLDAGCRIALKAAEPFEAHVFADLGPAPAGSDCGTVYCRMADRFLENGLKNFLVETLSSAEGIDILAAHLQEVCPEAFLLVSYAVGPDGITRSGYPGISLLRKTAGMPGVSGVGLNCMSGPTHMLNYVRTLPLSEFPCFSVMPNAGYPTVLGCRTVFNGDPNHFAQQMVRIAAAGATIIGGCCGTTPLHLEKTAHALVETPPETIVFSSAEGKSERKADENILWNKLETGQRVIAVELDPPVDDNIDAFLAGVSALKNAGADAITIADCPVGRPRADSSLLACKIHRELGVEPLPHMTCRDRNLFATKALLLGLSIEGVHNILLVTGDPIPTADRDEVKTVFNFNSRKLAAYVSTLNEGTLKTPFRMFGALNVNSKNFAIQLEMAKEKEACGISGFLTQPILSPEAVENLKEARKVLKGKILGGIYPIVSHRNACFMNNEIAGIHVSDEIVAMYEGKDRDASEALAVELSTMIAKEIKPYTDGFYLMTPFQRTVLMSRIIAKIQEEV